MDSRKGTKAANTLMVGFVMLLLLSSGAQAYWEWGYFFWCLECIIGPTCFFNIWHRCRMDAPMLTRLYCTIIAADWCDINHIHGDCEDPMPTIDADLQPPPYLPFCKNGSVTPDR